MEGYRGFAVMYDQDCGLGKCNMMIVIKKLPWDNTVLFDIDG